MLYIAKAADVAAAQEMVAAWAAHHAEYYGTSIGSRSVAPGDWCRGVPLLAASPHLSDAIGMGHKTDGHTHQWVRSSGTFVQVEFLPDCVMLRIGGRRHSVAEMDWPPNNALRRLVGSVTTCVTYDTQQPSWGPLDTADTADTHATA